MSSDQQLLALSFASGETSLSVRRFAVEEGLSRLYSVNIVAVSLRPDLDLESLVGHPASFRIMTNNPTAPERLWSGICSHFELVHGSMAASGIASQEESTYFFRIVPSLWVTTQRRDNRIFQQKTLPEIVQGILSEWKISASWELTKEQVDKTTATGPGDYYKKHDHIVQYGESDFEFISRLLERAGITFFFRFAGSEDTELVLSDKPHEGKPRDDMPIPCFDTPPLSPPPEYLTHVRLAHTVQPGPVALRDYDFRRQYDYDLLETSEGKVEAPEDFHEQYHYAPGESLVDVKKGGAPATPMADDRGIYARHDGDELSELSERRLQMHRKHKRWIRYESNCPDLAPGVLFSVSRHPRSELTAGGLSEGDDGASGKPRFMVAESFLEGDASGEWIYGGKAMLTDAAYVPDLGTAKPRIHGMQSVVVVGPPGEEIHTDEFGRVRVQFHWDREGKYDDKSSCWIRVSQDWAGAGFGTVMLPRIGQEVLVSFYEGDPEQPVIVGRVYNELTRVPYKLPDHKTRSTWKSDSSPTSDGFNEIMYEDKKGEELVYVQGQKDLQKLVKAFETARTGGDRIDIVGDERSTVVGELDARMVGGRYLLQMMKPASAQELKIDKQEEPNFSPTDTALEMVSEKIVFTTGQATMAFDGKDIRLEANSDITIHAKSGDVVVEGKHVYINTKSPSAAPQPGPFAALPPGTYSSQAADRLEKLKQQVDRTAAPVDLDAPDAPAWDGTIEKPEIVPCELISTQIFCEHAKAPRMPNDKGVLEVVPTDPTDTITLKSKLVGGCGDHTEWKVSGPKGTELLVGTNQEFKISFWKFKDLATRKLFTAWIPQIHPHVFTVYAHSCHGITANYVIRAYPSDELRWFFETKPKQKWEGGFFEKVRDAIGGFLGQAGVSRPKEMLSTRARPGGPPPKECVENGVYAEFLIGRVVVKGQWAEWPDDWRAYYKWSLSLEMFPLIAVTAKIPITPHLPPFVNWLGDAYLFVTLIGRITATAKVERKTPDSKWAVKPKVEVAGEIVARIGAEVHLLKKNLLSVKVFGETSVGVIAEYSPNASPLDPPSIDFYFRWRPLKVAIWGTFGVDFEWVKWTRMPSWLKFRRQFRKEWQLFEEKKAGPYPWNFLDSKAERKME